MIAAVSVVVPAHGSPDGVERLLRALETQARAMGSPLPVVVADDASARPLGAAVAPHLFPHLDLVVVRRHVNGGPGAARNTGLQAVSTPWVSFLDADMVPGPGWVARLHAIAAERDAPDGVEGRVTVPTDPPPTPFTHATEFSVAGTHHGAGNVAYRTAIVRSVGGFDERYFDPRRRLHFREDTDLYFRMVAAGHRLGYDPDLVALHPPLRASLLGPARLARRYYFDPLLSREHPQAFRAMVGTRRVGPVSLRRARHDSALLFAGGLASIPLGLLARRRWFAAAGAAALVAGWAANAVALSWRRHVRPRDLPGVILMSAVTPLVYLRHYQRGVRDFGHRPRF